MFTQRKIFYISFQTPVSIVFFKAANTAEVTAVDEFFHDETDQTKLKDLFIKIVLIGL